MNRFFTAFCCLAFVLFFSSCEKEPQESCANSPLIILENDDFLGTQNLLNSGFLILNEGGFTYGNASISLANNNWNISTNQLFQDRNDYALGDVLQSATIHKNEIYLTVNNSQKIEVVSATNFERKRTITGFTSPRYLAFNEANIAAVTDLYANSVLFFDTKNACIENQLTVDGWTEQIEYINGYFYIIEQTAIGQAVDFANLLIVDATSFQLVKQLPIALEPNSIILDDNNQLWILSSGKESENVLPELTKVDLTTNTIAQTWTYPDFDATPLHIAQGNGFLYYSLNNDIYKSSSNNFDFSTSQLLVDDAAENVYGLQILDNGDIVVSDAQDYIGSGKILLYNTTGVLQQEIDAGVIPKGVMIL